MNLQRIVLFCFYAKVAASYENDFILDYFYNKKVSSLVGFSCNEKMGKPYQNEMNE